MRGNHTISKIVPTRPDNAPSKQGTSGVPVELETNYFRIVKKPSWQLYLYRVDFAPEIEIRSLKEGMLYQQIKSFGPSLFDGTVLYLTVKLEREVTEFVTKSNRDKQPYQIKVKFVGLVSPDTHQYLHVWRLLLRHCEKALGLQLVGRNYYDAVSKVRVFSLILLRVIGWCSILSEQLRGLDSR